MACLDGFDDSIYIRQACNVSAFSIDFEHGDWFPVIDLRRIDSLSQAGNEFRTRNRRGAQRCQMRCLLLAVYHRNPTVFQEVDEVGQRNF